MNAKHKIQKIIPKIRKDRTLKLLFLPVIFIAVIKILFLFVYSGNSDFDASTLSLTPDVSAQEKADSPADKNAEPETTEVMDIPDIDNTDINDMNYGDFNPDFIKELKLREENIKRKQSSLELQEENLLKLKKQIEARIEELAKVEKNISKLLEQKDQVESEKIKKLAKVFEATPPEQAGALMSKLDIDIAAKLLINMTGRKAGKIWGFVTPDSAVLISKRLSEINPDFKIADQK